jgi:type VI secretion system secreted protein VgrG
MDLLQQILDLLGVSAAGIGQNARLLRLHTPLGDDVLLAERAEIVEHIGPRAIDASAEATPAEMGSGDVADGADAATADDTAGAGFAIRLTALATDASLALDELLGQPVLLELMTADSLTALRPWHGHVTQATLLGSDNGLARYELRVQPWLAFLHWRRDSVVFQDMSVVEIVEAVFARYVGQGQLMPAWRWALADTSVYPRRSLCIQYRETDLAFVQRLLAEEGLFCWFEHQGDTSSTSLGAHTLVIADHNGAFAPAAPGSVRYTQSASASFSEDGLQRFSPRRALATDSIELSSYDYRGLGLRPVAAAAAQIGDVPLTAVDVPGVYAYEDTTQGERLAQRWLEALQAPAQRWQGKGQWRALAPGQSFSVLDHPAQPTEPFVALALTHRARSNLGAAAEAGLQRTLGALPGWAGAARHAVSRLSARSGALHGLDASSLGSTIAEHAGRGADPRLRNASDEPLYALHFDAQPLSVAVRAPATAAGLSSRPTVHGTQTALVVGLDAPVHTDRDHRVKVQFHWQRGSQSSHGLDTSGDCNAPATDAAGTWVRVAEHWAGDNWGSHFVPRLGQEVVVAFIGGDIDRPVVTGAVYNGIGQAQANDAADAQGNQVAAGNAGASGNAPAWFPGQQPAGDLQGHQHPAVLQGYKSQELQASADGSGGYNQLVFDDTPGANRIELSSTMQASRLQLGALLQQRDNQRLDLRGHGFDLQTNAFGALRAGAGALLSSHARANSTAGDFAVDTREPQTTLQARQQLGSTLAASAQQHEVKASDEPTPDKLPCFVAQQGLYESLQATDGGDDAYAALGRPDLLLASAAGIVTATPASTVLSASTVSMTAGQDLTVTAQRHHATVAVNGIYLFTYGNASNPNKPNTETGIKLHAASGSVSVQAAAGQVLTAADQNVDVASTADAVTVGAPEHVLLAAGGSALQIEKGAITLTTSNGAKFLAAIKKLDGAGNVNRSAPTFGKDSLMDQASPQPFAKSLLLTDEDGYVLPYRPYRLWLSDGHFVDGITDENGLTREYESRTSVIVDVEFLQKVAIEP